MNVRWTQTRFLDRFADEGVAEDANWQPDAERLAQANRVMRVAAMATIAADIPRRLGGQVDGAELRADKRLSRQVRSRTLSLSMGWYGIGYLIDVRDLTQDGDVKKEGATVVWEDWWEEHSRKVNNHLRRIATQSKRHGCIPEGNRMAQMLVNELTTLDEVLGA